jgi:hypothetical protein
MSRSQRITWLLLSESSYSANIRNSLMMFTMPRFKKINGKVFGNDGAAHLLGTPPTALISGMKKFQ